MEISIIIKEQINFKIFQRMYVNHIAVYLGLRMTLKYIKLKSQ